MKTVLLFVCIYWAGLSCRAADVTVKPVTFQIDGTTYESVVIAPAHANGLPGVFMVPNWLGVTSGAKEIATQVASLGYVVYVADVYGQGVRPTNPDEAMKLVLLLRGDRELMRKRARAAFAHFVSLAPGYKIPDGKFAAIGFCFGGGTILELARTGAPLKAFVTFHGDLASPTIEADSAKITGKVLVLHGANDPTVPPADVARFETAMRATSVDWQLVSFGGAVHSYTDPDAHTPGTSQYNPLVSKRAFADMKALFDEIF